MWKRKRKRIFSKERKNKKFLGIFLSLSFFLSAIVIYYSISFYISSRVISLDPQAAKSFIPIQERNVVLIKNELRKKNIAFTDISIKNAIYEVVLIGGATVVLSANRSIIQQISSLQLILSHFTIEGEKISRVDLEFDKPVITME